MQMRIFGCIANEACVVIGNWDPFTTEHRDLLRSLTAHCSTANLSSVVVLIDPNPSAYIQGTSNWMIFEPWPVRLRHLRGAGVDAVAYLRFDEADLSAGAEQFFDLAAMHFSLREVWLGAKQSLGSGPQGSQAAISELARHRSFCLRRLPPSESAAASHRLRSEIANGRLASAIDIVGRPPLWRSNSRASADTPWPAGVYRAVFWKRADQLERTTLKIAQVGDRRQVQWPDAEQKYYAFVAGPADPTIDAARWDSAASCLQAAATFEPRLTETSQQPLTAFI